MHQFMIGQYGGFDFHKYHRDFKAAFYGIEACSFPGDEDCRLLMEESKSKGFRVGVHFPFRANGSTLRDALFLSSDPDEREAAFEQIRTELEYLTVLKPEYVLFHYPKPVILDDRVDWKLWRFGDRREYIFESECTLSGLIERSESLFEWLDLRSREYHFTPILEFDALNRYVYEHDFFEKLLLKYPQIQLCLDTARLHLQDKLDPRFDAKAVLRKYAKYAGLIHLSTAQVNQTVQNSHYPVLPELSVQDGWAPIAEYLQIVRGENSRVKIMFEHRSDLITEDQLQQCYEWVDGILKGSVYF
ncbi:sugar phosphate isomerase/epimerase [Paenibacillus sonchi]|nr:sugar phosphate isomerase/epimerase [Paenibacillus sonchi]